MSRRRVLADRLSAYRDVRTMLSTMKNFAMMEMRKLGGQIERQQAVMQTIHDVAMDFVSAHDLRIEPRRSLCIAIGSERGFCGAFNEELVPGIEARLKKGAMVLPIGRRLVECLQDAEIDYAMRGCPQFHPGPTVAEEIPAILNGIARCIEQAQSLTPEVIMQVEVLSHDHDGPREKVIAPIPVSDLPSGRSYASPPCLNLPAVDFFAAFVEQSVQLGLFDVFARSLAAENRRRLIHMERALHRLDDMQEALQRRINAARQEEIIQEIETVLLSTGLSQEHEPA